MTADERTGKPGSPEEALRESEARYRTLFESLDAAVLLMRGDVCVECNPATLTLFGFASKDEIIGKTPLDFAPAKQPDGRDSAELVRWNAEIALEKGLHVFEWQAFKKGGEPVFMEVRFTPYRIGNEQFFQCIAIDITERKRAEEELRKSEALLARSQEMAHVGSWVLEIATNRLTWSDEVYRIFGLQPREFGATYEAFLDSVHPDDRASVNAAYSGSLRDGSDGYEIEHRIIRKRSGEIRHVHEICTHERDAGGRIVRSVGIVQDITERKRAEETQRESEERWRDLVETSAAWIWETDANIRHVYTNRFVTHCLGYQPDEFLGFNIPSLIHPDDRHLLEAIVRGATGSKEGWSGQVLRWRHKDGSWKYIETSGVPVFDRQGNFAGLRGIDRDITESRMAEEKLRESEAQHSLVFNSTSDMLALMRAEPDGRFIIQALNQSYLNTVSSAFPGVSIENFIGCERGEFLRALTRYHEPDAETTLHRATEETTVHRATEETTLYRTVVETRTEVRYEVELPSPAGNMILDINLTPILDQGGTCTHVLWNARNITERKRSDAAMRESEERLSALSANLADSMVYQINSGPDGRLRQFTYLSPAVERFHGLTVEAVLRDPWLLYGQVAEEDQARLAGEEARVFANKVKLDIDVRVRMPSGEVRWRRFISSPRWAPDGNWLWDGIEVDITDRMKAENALAEREGMLKQIMDTASVGIALVDKAGSFTHANRSMAEMFGCTMEELIGSEYVDYVHPSEREISRMNMLALLASEIQFVDLVRRYRRKDRTEFWGHLTCRRFHDVHGDDLGLVGVITDITERKLAEDALRESEERYRQLFDAESDALFLIDNETGSILMANDAAASLYGYRREELLKKKNTDLSAEPSETQRVTVETPVKKENAVTIPLRYHRKKDGTVFPVEITGRFFISQGRSVHIAAIRDITERKRTEDELKSEREFIGKALNAQLDTFFVFEPRTGKALRWNSRFRDVSGYSDEEIARLKAPDSYYDRTDLEKAVSVIEKIGREGVGTVELDLVCKDGKKVPFEYVASVIYNEAGEPTSIISIGRDITERKRTEEALEESERSLKTLMGNLPGMAYRCRNDRARTMEYVSEGSYALTGHHPAELVGNAKLSYNDLVQPEDREIVWQAVQSAVGKKEKYTLLYRIRRAEGQERWVWEQGQGVFSATGGLLALEGFIIDVTERRLLEEERLKGQKLESVGTLAGGIAHDFNNLLQGIFGYISLAKITIDRKERSLEMLQQAEKALHHAVSLTNQLLTFSKGGKPVKRRISLAPLIDDAVRFALSGSTTDYRTEVSEGLSEVEADGGQIAQVIQNIVLNADHAMPMGGTVLVGAGNARAPGAGVPVQLAEGDYVRISIQDSGIGIPEQYLSRIFDPYFTTKEKGSGLGLATSYSIIRNHNGLIDVRSEVGAGSVFTIYLPAKPAYTELPAAAEPAAAGPARRCKVLVMDDEEVVRSVARELMQLLGHEAHLAADGREAIEIYRQAIAEGGPFDVVILDLTVRGGMGGLETIQRLREIDPGVNAVVSSGYSDDAIGSEFRMYGFRAFLKKPYDTDELKTVLNTLLAGRETMSS